MSELTQTDVSRPSALPSARLRPTASQPQSIADQSSAEYLDFVEEEWNKKVDVEVDTLVDGMVEIVNLASIGDKDKFKAAQEAFETQCRADSMVRAAHSLLSITHSMKLLLLLSDESQIVQQRDRALKDVRKDAEESKRKVAELLNDLLLKDTRAQILKAPLPVLDFKDLLHYGFHLSQDTMSPTECS